MTRLRSWYKNQKRTRRRVKAMNAIEDNMKIVGLERYQRRDVMRTIYRWGKR